MIGKLRTVVLDSARPAELARFYAAMLGATVVSEEPDWVVITEESGRRLAFQLSPEHQPPRFPDTTGSQQFHLDIMVEDIDTAERAVLDLGATRLDGQGSDFRVYADPAGHPFCLLWQD
jgi:catechol-2,3-dioxygenase